MDGLNTMTAADRAFMERRLPRSLERLQAVYPEREQPTPETIVEEMPAALLTSKELGGPDQSA